MGSREKMNDFLAKKDLQIKSDKQDSVCMSRINELLDEDSFVEINSHVKSRGISFGYEREKVEGDGVVVGYGSIDGNLVFVAAQDPDVYAGSVGQMHASKISEVIDMAIRSNAPFIGLYDSGGVRIEEGILALEGMSQVISGLSIASEQIPTIAGIFGPCAGASAIAASLSNLKFMTKESSGIYMNGPMVTAAKEGETIEAAQIGGAKVHAEKTGLVNFVCEDESDCIQSIKNIFEYIPGYANEEGVASFDDPNRLDARLDEIANSIDQDYDVKEIVKSVVDNDTFIELSKDFCAGVVTAYAKLDGIPVAIIANQEKRLDAKMAKKLKSFVRTADVLGMPLISFVDSQGYAIGLVHEYSDIIESAGELYKELEIYSSPKISIIVGEAIGTAYMTLASKQNGFDFVYAWPTAQIAVVQSDTAANIIYKDEIAKSSDVISSRADFVTKYENDIANASVAASLGHVDEIILPSSTRPRLISSLQIL